MSPKELVKSWFEKWEEGDFLNLPVTEDFKHTSPYGTIDGKEEYLNLVKANKEKFLGHRFELDDEIYGEDSACVRYTTTQDNFTMEVSEWYYLSNGLIKEIIAYYNIEGEINNDRKLNEPN